MSENKNTWIVRLDAEARLDELAIKMDLMSSKLPGIREGDALLIVGEGSGAPEAWQVGVAELIS